MKTAEELKLSSAEYTALLQVRAMLNDTETYHAEVNRRYPYSTRFKDSKEINLLDGFGGFDMANTCLSSEDPEERGFECGTTACIGGWMGVFMWDKAPVTGQQHIIQPEIASRIDNFVKDFSPDRYWRRGNDPIAALFFPMYSMMDDIRTSHAVQAIDHFLEHGQIDDDVWSNIVYGMDWEEYCAQLNAEEDV